ncbi:MAG: hypothetical protein Q9212_002751 [Teloschistes hypoglaucus]
MAQTTNGFLTSIDIARQRSYTLNSYAGLKRPLEQVSAAEAQIERDDLASKIHDADSEITDAGGSTAPPRLFDVTSLPSSSLNPLLTLSHPRYGLPESLVQNFASMSIRNIYPWQSSCLLGRGLLTGEKNLVYTAPTGGGKSLVADVLMLKKILGSPHTKAILVLPYVALVQEKIAWLRKVVEGVEKDLQNSSSGVERKCSRLRKDRSVRVVGFFGGSKTRAAWGDVDIAVCTFEKANMLVNTAIEQCTIGDLGVVVLDELHMIDDDHRGYLMELLATKLLSLESSDIIHDLSILAVGLDESLGMTIPKGVAFHHAGLAAEEREILARAYDNRVILVIVATCSLAAGINLPARRVIIDGTRMGRDAIGPAMLRQMRGRAGRKGKDEVGESYLCCKKDRLDEATKILGPDLPIVESSMTREKRGIKRALLEVITVRLATHMNAIEDYVQRTLVSHTMKKAELKEWVQKVILELQASGQITVDSNGIYEATPLSRATVGSCMTPEDGVFVHDELQRGLQAFVMDGDLHVFYMFTPVNIWGVGDIDWRIFRDEIERLDESGMRALNFVGGKPALVNRMAVSGGQLPEDDAENLRIARIYRRSYAVFQLRDLCNEIPMPMIARRYGIPRGNLQTLAQTCEGFAAGMIHFCDTMGWGMLKSVLEHMSDRLKAGARADLLELARIPFVKSRTARVFWENGMQSLRAVAAADAKELVPLLLLAQPKKYTAEKAEDERYRQKLLLRSEVIIEAANRLWAREQQFEIEDEE